MPRTTPHPHNPPRLPLLLGGVALVGGALAVLACGGGRAPTSLGAPQGPPTATALHPVARGGPLRERSLSDTSAPAPASPSSPPESERKTSSHKDQAPRGELTLAHGAHPPPPGWNTETYDHIAENGFVSATDAPLSTFSIDVDTASYSNVRRFLTQEQKPPAGAVRLEELVNYFDYDYPAPRGAEPFSVHTELGPAPWAPEHRLLHIGLQGRRIAPAALPPRNLVFLIDVSGSMDEPNKLPLLKRSFVALLSTLGERDSVALVVYAGASGLVLPPTKAHHKAEISAALERLHAGGSTNGGEGIELAYAAAARGFVAGGVNRVILATDGDFNVGTTSESELVRLIEEKRNSGVFLTVLGYGMGNYKDSALEKLADHGNGNYAYIDSFEEARKVLVEEGGANLVTIAQDVKIQVEMNPAFVGAYRLIGYENRRLANEDFANDEKDAGEIGAGHTVTALYELLTPAQAARTLKGEELRYQRPQEPSDNQEELCTIKLRFKQPLGQTSRLIEFPVAPAASTLANTSDAFRFSAAVASFGMLLRGSAFSGVASYRSVSDLAGGALGSDPGNYRREFLGLVARAEGLQP